MTEQKNQQQIQQQAALNKLKTLIKAQKDEALSVDAFMRFALYDPEFGYYTSKEHIFGAEGDFITAPEISQLFGETLSLWVAHCWQLMGEPEHFTLVELGAGQGTLMSDMLRSLEKTLPQLYEQMTVLIVDPSLKLQEKQRKKLHNHKEKITWFADVKELPVLKNAVLIANEVLDALPLKQYVRTEEGFKEKLIKLDNQEQLSFSQSSQLSDLSHLHIEADETTVEWDKSLEDFLDILKEKMQKGYMLFIDYGDLGFADTLQALHKHKSVDILSSVGHADLTMHVNFKQVRQHLGAQTSYNEMRHFLAEFAIGIRAAQLVKQNPLAEAEITWQLNKLLSPTEMGTLFKVLMYKTKELPETIGFSHANI